MLLEHVSSNPKGVRKRNSQMTHSFKNARRNLFSKLSRQSELDMLLDPAHLRHLNVPDDSPHGIDDVEYQRLGSRRTRGQADCLFPLQPRGIQLGSVRDQIAREALLKTDFAQAVRIRAVLRADDQDEI